MKFNARRLSRVEKMFIKMVNAMGTTAKKFLKDAARFMYRHPICNMIVLTVNALYIGAIWSPIWSLIGNSIGRAIYHNDFQHGGGQEYWESLMNELAEIQQNPVGEMLVEAGTLGRTFAFLAMLVAICMVAGGAFCLFAKVAILIEEKIEKHTKATSSRSRV